MLGGHRATSDAAESGIIGQILLVALAIFMAGLLYANLSDPRSEPPNSVGLSQNGATSTTRSFVVSTATSGMRWQEVVPTLDGTPLAYDAALAGDGTFCIVATGASCGAYDGSATVGAGDELRVRDASIQGKTFALRDVDANAIIYSLHLGAP